MSILYIKGDNNKSPLPGGEIRIRGEIMISIDPVCSMEVEMETGFSYDYEGKIYYFCSQGCLEEFKQNPSFFLSENSLYGIHNCAC
jgi:YHS domain-containing protein